MFRLSARRFTTARIARNSIQDLYVKELKAFKPISLTSKDAEGAVKPWTAPIAPAVPGLEADAATQLGEYAAEPVEVASAADAAAGANEASSEWFVFEEAEEEAHH